MQQFSLKFAKDALDWIHPTCIGREENEVESGIERSEDLSRNARMGTPVIDDDVHVLVRVLRKQRLEAFDDDERVFPVVKPPVFLTGVHVDGCGHFQQPLDFLFAVPLDASSPCVDMTVVVFNGNLCFLVEAVDDALWGGLCFERIDYEFFFANCGSLLKSQGVFFLYLMVSSLMIRRTCEALTAMP